VIELYQFPYSHFCEKARWALDYKGLPFVERNLLPGLHLYEVRNLAPATSLPILVDDGQALQDSTVIITYLDRKVAGAPLTPADPELARQALAWEDDLGREIGVTLRQWFYFHALPDRRRATRFLMQGSSGWRRLVFPLMFPAIRSAMVRAMNIRPQPAQRAQERLEAAIARLDEALQKSPFLVGGQFTRADLTACALLAPLVGIGRTEDEMAATSPAAVQALRQRYAGGRVFEWVTRVYADHRRRMNGP
jgi:glutathione S-transferase